MVENMGGRWSEMVQQGSEAACFMEIRPGLGGGKERDQQSQNPCQKSGEEGRKKGGEESDKKERGINLRLRYAESLNFKPFG